jgi:hypothetical protein
MEAERPRPVERPAVEAERIEEEAGR